MRSQLFRGPVWQETFTEVKDVAGQEKGSVLLNRTVHLSKADLSGDHWVEQTLHPRHTLQISVSVTNVLSSLFYPQRATAETTAPQRLLPVTHSTVLLVLNASRRTAQLPAGVVPTSWWAEAAAKVTVIFSLLIPFIPACHQGFLKLSLLPLSIPACCQGFLKLSLLHPFIPACCQGFLKLSLLYPSIPACHEGCWLSVYSQASLVVPLSTLLRQVSIASVCLCQWSGPICMKGK